MGAELDHIVVGCADLASGERWLTDLLGVEAQGGGVHETMGTHNKLWSLGEAYLELIAVNPDAPAPPRRRWYALDDHTVQGRLSQGPHLLTWVVRVDDLDTAMEAAPVDMGTALDVSRGDLSWRMAVPDDGALHDQGQIPYLIQWKGAKPTDAMQAQGLSLASLTAFAPQAVMVERVLDAVGAKGMIDVQGGRMRSELIAEIATPENGNVSLVG